MAGLGEYLGAVVLWAILIGVPVAFTVDRVMIYRADHKGCAARDAWRAIKAAVWEAVTFALWTALALVVLGLLALFILWLLFGPSAPAAASGSVPEWVWIVLFCFLLNGGLFASRNR